MQSQLYFTPFRTFLLRYQSALVVVTGFASAFLLGWLLWSLTATTWAASTITEVGGAVNDTAAAIEKPAKPVEVGGGALSPVFTAQVRHWEPQILAWAAEYNLDPNMVATLIQIESCGNPQAISSAGARGLFQVMPFHFGEGEDMLDPETNAKRGLSYFVQSLALTEGHVGMAFAGYNGGHVAAQSNWESWPQETRRYYRWGSGIYNDVSSGLTDSPTLHDWLAAGGSSLCQQAAGQLAAQ